ncbi:DUF397 domain-containing protein [Streptomonospora sediminis]
MPDSTASDLRFRKSSYSMGGREDCVEVADATGASAVRDSQHPEIGHIMFPASEWDAFLADVKADRL